MAGTLQVERDGTLALLTLSNHEVLAKVAHPRLLPSTIGPVHVRLRVITIPPSVSAVRIVSHITLR